MTMARRLFLALFLSCMRANAWTASKNSISPNQESLVTRRRALLPIFTTLFPVAAASAASYSGPTIDINNAMAREFTAFPGYVLMITCTLVFFLLSHNLHQCF
jgi:hypothetical protein